MSAAIENARSRILIALKVKIVTAQRRGAAEHEEPRPLHELLGFLSPRSGPAVAQMPQVPTDSVLAVRLISGETPPHQAPGY